jgi:hypothetical protein
VYITNSLNRSLQLSIFSILIVLFFFSLTTSVLSQEYKPRAVVMGLNTSTSPDFSEQILLHKLKYELAGSFDLSKQRAFEKALQKLENTAENNYCLQLKCMLEVHAAFPKTSLFLLKSQPEDQRLTLILIGENKLWRVKHEICSLCALTSEEMLTNVVLRMQSYLRPPMVEEQTSLNTLSTSTSPETVSKKADSEKGKNKTAKFWSDTKLRKGTESLEPKASLPLEELQFKIAQRRYNQLIWRKIKKDLMFFRQKNRNLSVRNLKARLRLQIDKYGKVIERRLLKASGSNKFDKSILDSVDLLKLPPPMELLIRHPPYVVTILIQP